MFEVEEVKPERMRHFGIMVRDEKQLAEVGEKVAKKYGLQPIKVSAAIFVIRPAIGFRWATCTTNR